MKLTSLSLPAAAAALLTVAFFAITTVAQAPQAAAGGPPPPPRTFPAPTNLKVLPKNLTGQQVHDIMEQWEGSLGAKCSTCHTPDPKNIGPNGRPRLDFVDDSKPEKTTARSMYAMMEDINKNYVAKIDSSGAPVTCGTCHRGHLGPEPFVIPPDDGPRMPQSTMPTATKPAQSK
ncbi:MAG: c-type cytochrome [Terracidiphilus sp.]|nr:c-type cytochrome [Terracidiphilus sp.]MDR3776355.1 c-type cytochrome [Terracidiphilus sp.]